MKPRTRILVGALAAALVAGGVAIWALTRPVADSETSSVAPTSGGAISASGAPATPALAAPAPIAPVLPTLPGAGAGSAEPYPVDLEDLRARLPANRYWEIGVPTRDPAVARARAERAKRSNELFGRTQTGEATEPEIRAYYAEQQRVSEDYLQLSLLVLQEKGDQLPERDRGMFELSAKMHKDRLIQIQRDLADALARRRERHP
ncbi:MAG TPA: hypothetical protein VNO30_37490 [Kofleriaceae bacterium]|nr:hypothetical protein [Kofleriaceae bacterium]